MEGGGGHAPPRSARLRGPPPPFSRATSTSARFARRPNRWNAPLSLRYGAPPRANQRLRGATKARCVGAPCSPPANTARQMAASQTRQPAPLRRQADVSRSASGAQVRAFTRSGESGSRDTRTPGFERFPGQRITSPSFGNARKLAGLRCGLVMRWPPVSVWPLAGQANSSFLPPSSA